MMLEGRVEIDNTSPEVGVQKIRNFWIMNQGSSKIRYTFICSCRYFFSSFVPILFFLNSLIPNFLKKTDILSFLLVELKEFILIIFPKNHIVFIKDLNLV